MKNKASLLGTLVLSLAIFSSKSSSFDSVDQRTEAVRKQLQTQEYLNTCLNQPYPTLNQGIQQLDKGNNLAIWTTYEIDAFKEINKNANNAKHKW